MADKNRPLHILLTNDDGIHAPGLWAMFHALESMHQLAVVAPERERSAVGHSITLHKPLRAFQVTVNGGDQGWAVTGTPVDCVKLSMLELLDDKPDLVVSGINAGANTGINLNYSGTVAAAREAAVYGVPALAVSIQGADAPDYDAAARFIARLIPRVMTAGLPRGVFLNVNLPSTTVDQTTEVKITRQGGELYDEFFDRRSDPRNRSYYWSGYESQPVYSQEDTDGAVLSTGRISITPIKCDMTDYDVMADIARWPIGNDR